MKKEFEKRILSSLILIPLSFFIIIKGSFLFNFFLLICFLITSYEWFMMSKKKNYHIPGYLFLIFSFYSAFFLRNNLEEKSLIIFLLIIIICISTDIGGYIFGNIFKGPKLTKISPKKTYSGMIGGYLLAIINVNIFFHYSYFFYDELTEFTYEVLLLVLLISSISQIGDISISYLHHL